MIYGENNYTINLESVIHIDQIKELIELYKDGVTVDHLEKFTNHINNFQRHDSPERKKSLKEWEEYFKKLTPQEVYLSAKQIAGIFKYFQRNGEGSSIEIRQDFIRTTMPRKELKKECKLEYIVLKTLEMANP